MPTGLVPGEPVPGVLTAGGPTPDGLPTALKPAGPKLAGLAEPELRSCGARLAWRTRTGSPTSVTSAVVARASPSLNGEPSTVRSVTLSLGSGVPMILGSGVPKLVGSKVLGSGVPKPLRS